MTSHYEVRVVHVSAHYPPYLGGLEKVVESLAVNRSRRNLPVEVMTSLDGWRKRGRAGKEGLVRRLRSFEVANTSIMPGLLVALLRLPRRSIVHLHVAQAFVPEAVYAAHVLSGLSYVAQIHLDIGPSSWIGFLLRVYKPLVLGPVFRAAEAVVVFTEEQKSFVSAKYRIDPARIHVIPNGVDKQFVYPEERSLHPKPRLLFVGRLSVQKNLILLLRSLEGISERFETTLVGDGDLEQALRRAAKDLGLENVRFYGRAEGDELRQLYRESDVFILPSDREGFPLVLLEAIAMGLPVVATDVPGNRDVVIHGENGVLVPLGDPGTLRQALLKVTESDDVYRRMSKGSRELAVKYSWDVVSDQFECLYARLGKPS